MTPEQARRFNQAMEGFVNQYPHPDYSTMISPHDPDTIFTLVRRRSAGSPGPKWTPVGSITYAQAHIIAETSHSMEEMRQRIQMLVIDGKDTTRVQHESAPSNRDIYTADEVKNLVKQAIIEFQKQQRGDAPERETEEVVEEVVSPPEPEKKGIQMKPRKSVKDYQKANREKLDILTKRAALVGMRPPTFRRDGKPDGRWMRRFEGLWAKYLEKNPEPATAE